MKQEAIHLLNSIVKNSSEWLEMSDEPLVLLNGILVNMLYEEKELTKYLTKIAYKRPEPTACNNKFHSD